MCAWLGRAIAATVGGIALAACQGDRPAANASPNAASSAARGSSGDSAAIEATDDGEHVVRLSGPARRIVSLIPSSTEIIIALGASDRVVGRTRYDVAPEVAAAPLVGGTIDPSIETIVALHPDLVLAWENDRRRQLRTKLVALGVPVFSLRTEDTTDVFRNIHNLGRLLARDSAAAALAASLHSELDDVRRAVAGRSAPSVFYVVFNDPPMTAGPSTFIAQLIGVAGGRSLFPDVRQLWPTVAIEEIVRRQPDIVIAPQGEFRTNAIERFRAMPGWRDLRAVRSGRVVAVPSDLVNRPGPRIGEAARALRAAIHPELGAAVAAPREGPRP